MSVPHTDHMYFKNTFPYHS